ncbi:MAG TPA: hypothetical protein VN688_17035 [Gemmataceae bacterium]|nr:hypothetical protein [Gemmataceae bacterium]
MSIQTNGSAAEDARGFWRGWLPALLGQFLFVVAVVSLSGPGRLDIIDGQPRYEVARSLVEHGDTVIRNPEVTFCVLPGRNGQRYSCYRLPQSLAGVVAIWSADATGPRDEMRRQFFFVLTSAVACGILATFYALWFRRLGYRPISAISWSLGGIFCTPCWFYGTSVFDDILGTTAVVMALTLAWYGRQSKPRLFAGLAGLALGLAFNCKQPLGLFLLPVLALTVKQGETWRSRLPRMALVLMGLGVGLLAYKSYEWYKFPPGSTAEHARLLAQYVPAFPGNPLAGFLGLLLSPGAGAFWYCPTLLLSLLGLRTWLREYRLFTQALLVACAGFTAFLCCLVFFKGDLSWGPRYLTLIFAVFWVFVPAAVNAHGWRPARLLLGLGLFVQLLGLSVDYHRLYVELRFPSGFYQGHPWIYFHPRAAHLVNRPREIWEILTETQSAIAYSPTDPPTAAMPCPEFFERGPEAVRKYRCFSSFRPWWASMTFLSPHERPVDLGSTAVLLLALAASGLVLMGIGCGRRARLSQAPSIREERPGVQEATGCVRPFKVHAGAKRR